jgi:hypothetical protein
LYIAAFPTPTANARLNRFAKRFMPFKIFQRLTVVPLWSRSIDYFGVVIKPMP